MRGILAILLILALASTSLASVDASVSDSSLHKPSPLKIGIYSAAVASVVSYSLLKFYSVWDTTHVGFHFKKDDLRGDRLLLLDEVAHLFGAYAFVRAGAGLSRWAGLSEKTSILAGVGISFFVMTFMEYPLDAYKPNEGVSISDLAFDYAGTAIGVLREATPALHNFDIKVGFENLSRIPPEFLPRSTPEHGVFVYWLTYSPAPESLPLNIGLGYSVRHDERRQPHHEWYVGVGTSLTELSKRFLGKYASDFEYLGVVEVALTAKIVD